MICKLYRDYFAGFKQCQQTDNDHNFSLLKPSAYI